MDETIQHYPMTLEAVKAMGYQIIPWDGRYTFVLELQSGNLMNWKKKSDPHSGQT